MTHRWQSEVGSDSPCFTASLRADLHNPLDVWFERCAMFAVRPNDRGRDPVAVETTLIDAACSGDQDAFRQIVEGYQSTLTIQMRRFSRDPNAVEDLVHDVFVEAFMSLASFRRKSPFEHWLRKIAVRVGYRHWQLEARDKRRQEKLREQSATATIIAEPASDATEARDQLHAIMSKLSPRDRLVLTLLYWDGYSVAEAAKLAGWTQTMVKVQAHRARKRLKKLLEETDEPEHS